MTGATTLRTVVLIDDNDADNFFHGLLIEQSGKVARLQTFEWAEKALEWFRAHPGHDVDLILLDINMPRMNGFEFLEAFHDLPPPSRSEVRICMLSSSSLECDRERASRFAQVSDFIVKPLTEELIDQLASVRDMRR